MTIPTQVKTLKINGIDIGGRADQTILEVAREHNINIPTLCHLTGLSDVGACRLCLVEIKGIPKLIPACTTFVDEGMEVSTDSERLVKYRKMILELLMSERNHICSVCVTNGHCDLQSLDQELGVTHIRFPYRYPKLSVDASHDRFVIDQNRCILCTRCVRVCDEIEGAHTWDLMGRGIKSQVITDTQSAMGSIRKLHKLWKMRAGLSDWRTVRKRKIGCRNVQAKTISSLSYSDEGRKRIAISGI